MDYKYLGTEEVNASLKDVLFDLKNQDASFADMLNNMELVFNEPDYIGWKSPEKSTEDISASSLANFFYKDFDSKKIYEGRIGALNFANDMQRKYGDRPYYTSGDLEDDACLVNQTARFIAKSELIRALHFSKINADSLINDDNVDKVCLFLK